MEQRGFAYEEDTNLVLVSAFARSVEFSRAAREKVLSTLLFGIGSLPRYLHVLLFVRHTYRRHPLESNFNMILLNPNTSPVIFLLVLMVAGSTGFGRSNFRIRHATSRCPQCPRPDGQRNCPTDRQTDRQAQDRDASGDLYGCCDTRKWPTIQKTDRLL